MDSDTLPHAPMPRRIHYCMGECTIFGTPTNTRAELLHGCHCRTTSLELALFLTDATCEWSHVHRGQPQTWSGYCPTNVLSNSERFTRRILDLSSPLQMLHGSHPENHTDVCSPTLCRFIWDASTLHRAQHHRTTCDTQSPHPCILEIYGESPRATGVLHAYYGPVS